MKLDKSAIKEIRNVSLGVLAGDVLVLLVYFIIGRREFKVLYSVILGSIVAMAGFVWLCFSVQKLVNDAEKGIRTKMTSSYVGRLILYGAWVVVCAKFAFIEPLAGVAPVFFPSLAIKVLSFFNSSGNKEDKK